jgi:hypothetical protein
MHYNNSNMWSHFYFSYLLTCLLVILYYINWYVQGFMLICMIEISITIDNEQNVISQIKLIIILFDN